MKTITVVSAIGVLLGGAAIAAGAVFPPDPASKQIDTVTVSGVRLLACPVSNPELGTNKVVATGVKPLQWWTIDQPAPATPSPDPTPGGPAAQPTYERGIMNDVSTAVLVSGGQSVGAMISATEGTETMAGICTAPVSTAWWDGVMSTETQTAIVLLTNVDDAEAVVDFTLFGREGPLTVPGLRDLRVPGHTTMPVSFQDKVTSDTPITIEARTSVGRVVATLREYGDLGSSFHTPMTAPATTLVIPGIPAGDGARTLVVTNATSTRATISVSVLGDNGAWTPIGAESLSASPTSTVTLDLTPGLRGVTGGLLLMSSQPITAALVAEEPDRAAVQAQPPLEGGVVLPTFGGTLAVSNPGSTSADLRIELFDGGGVSVGTQTVTVPAQSSVQTPIDSQDGSILISTQAKGLRAAFIYTDGGLSIVPLGAGGAVSTTVPVQLNPALG